MSRAYRLFLTGWLVFAASWFIQIVSVSECRIGQGCLPGWEALRVALSPIWAYKDFDVELALWGQALIVVSGLSNVLVLLTTLVFLSRSIRAFHIIGWSLGGAALVHMYWLPLLGADLRAGYYLWAGSFVLLAIAARLRMRRRSVVEAA